MDFKAAMFDFDGTITNLGEYTPSVEMSQYLVKLAQKMPIAFCTGRQLESFEHRGLSTLLENIEENVVLKGLKSRLPDMVTGCREQKSEKSSFLKNLYLIAENGAMGYDYNIELNRFEQFYEVPWPEAFLPRAELQKLLEEAIKDYGNIYFNAHKVVVVMRTKLHDQEHRSMEEVRELSEKIYEITVALLDRLKPEFEEQIHVGNSGIGVVVGPADGDKDRGIKEFARILRERRGLEIGKKAREIIVVGDSPLKSGNDHYFLNGDFGTPYTVGSALAGNKSLNVVTDDHGKRLLNARGTLHLIKRLLVPL